MQVGHGLAHRKGFLVQVERSLEHDGHHVGCAGGLPAAQLHHFRQPVAVVVV